MGSNSGLGSGPEFDLVKQGTEALGVGQERRPKGKGQSTQGIRPESNQPKGLTWRKKSQVGVDSETGGPVPPWPAKPQTATSKVIEALTEEQPQVAGSVKHGEVNPGSSVARSETNALDSVQTWSTAVDTEIPTSITRSRGDSDRNKGKTVSVQSRDTVTEPILPQLIPPLAQIELEASGELMLINHVMDREAGEIIEADEGHNEVLTSMVEGGNCLVSEPELVVAVYEEETDSSSPLQMTPLQMVSEESSDWVFKQVEKIQSCVGLFYDGYEEQLRALLVAIEAGRSTVEQSSVKKKRELRRLHCSINYDNKEGTSGRSRSKGREVIFVNEA
ncbi:hypothetical protein F2P56_015952 [Juglans regia]|uniref:Uncharacterized protein n=1 Tax=Juglans regia TaxID=51240 RepID=A0A834CVV1_JUGRE|nr:hypothetical protein F2P56_015952 [Juglans regia]